MAGYANQWAEFANKVDVKAINEGLKNMPKGEFEELPDGKYEVSLDSLELKPSKDKGLPVVKMELTIVHGEFENRKIFINELLWYGDDYDMKRVGKCNALLAGLQSNETVVFAGVPEYAEMVDRIAKQCVGYEYLISKKSSVSKKNGKTYINYKFLEAY